MKRTRLAAILCFFIFSAVFFAGGVWAADITFGSSGPWAGGTIDTDYEIEILDGATVTIDNNVHMSGNSGGDRILTKSGSGTLLFSDGKEFAGKLVIEGGTVDIAQSNIAFARNEPNFIAINNGSLLRLTNGDSLTHIALTPWMIYVNDGTIHSTAGGHQSMGHITLTNGTISADTGGYGYLFDGKITVTDGGTSSITAQNVRFRNASLSEPARIAYKGGWFDIETNGTLTMSSNIGSFNMDHPAQLIKTGEGTLILSGNNNSTADDNRAMEEYVKNGTIERIAGTASNTIYVGHTGGINGISYEDVAGQVGIYNLTGTGKLSGKIVIGYGGTGVMTVSDGGEIDFTAVLPDWVPSLDVGTDGTLNVQNNGKVSTSYLYVSSGLMNVSGGEVNTTGVLCVGNSGAATLNVTGGQINANNPEGILLGGNAGSTGTMNVDGGSINSAASPGRIRIGVNDGGVGILNVYNGNVYATSLVLGAYAKPEFPGSAGTMNVYGGNIQTTDNISLGDQARTSGTLNVYTGGSLNLAGQRIYVGLNGTGELNVEGGEIRFQEISIGQNSTGVGTMTLSAGEASAVDQIQVGNTGKGTLEVSGGKLSSSSFAIGNGGNSEGEMTVSGGGEVSVSEWFCVGHRDGSQGKLTVKDGGTLNTGSLYVGTWDSSRGEMIVNGGTVNTGGFRIGAGHYAVGNVKVYDGSTINANDLVIGDKGNNGSNHAGGTGTLDIYGGDFTINDNNIRLGVGSESKGTINVLGGTVTGFAGKTILVGQDGTGDLNIDGGNIEFANVRLGEQNGSTGTLDVKSGGLKVANELFIGIRGTGTMNIYGGTIEVAQDIQLGVYSTAKGTMNVFGGNTNLSDRVLYVGVEGAGEWNVSDGNIQFRSINISERSGSTGTVNVSDGAVTSNQIIVGNRDSGTFQQDGGTVTVNGGLTVGTGTGGTGVYNLTNGLLSANSAAIGNGGTGTVTVSGSGQMTVSGNTSLNGSSPGFGKLAISDNGQVSTTSFFIGDNGNGIGIVEITGGKLTVNDWFCIGHSDNGNGTVIVDGGELITTHGAADHGIHIGTHGNTTGTMIVKSGKVNTAENPRPIRIGTNGNSTGTLEVSGGEVYATTIFLSENSTGATGTMTISGDGFVSVRDSLLVGNAGKGTVNLDGGLLLADTINISGSYDSSMEMRTGGTLWTKNVTGNLANTGGVLDLVHGDAGALGTTTINGNYTQGTDGTLRLELNFNGTDIFNDFLDITKTATLAGTLDLLLTGSDWAVLIDTYTEIPILHYGEGIFGGFSISSDSIGFDAFDWAFLTKNDGYGYLSLTPMNDDSGVTPEPGTWAMLLMGIGGLAGMARYRRKK